MTRPDESIRTVAVLVVAACSVGQTEAAQAPTPAAAERPADPWPPATGSGPCSDAMVRIAGGTFTLGMRGDEVTLDEFCLDRTEVTVAAYRGCVAAGACEGAMQTIHWPNIGDAERRKWSAECNGRFPDRSEHPANCVGWEQADAFCRARGVRLPTEEEWEWTARGAEAAYPYPWGADVPDATRLNACGVECKAYLAERGLKWAALHSGDDGFPVTAPVGSFPSGDNAAGVTDLGGNVFEWTATGADGHPQAPSRYKRAGQKIARGAGFRATQPEHARVELRVAVPPEIRNTYGGFRCASD